MKYEWCPVCDSKTRDLAHHVGYWHTELYGCLIKCVCGGVFGGDTIRDHWEHYGGLDVHIMEVALR